MKGHLGPSKFGMSLEAQGITLVFGGISRDFAGISRQTRPKSLSKKMPLGSILVPD